MKKIIFTATILITSKLFAEPAEPLAPTVFAPWSTGLRNSDDSLYPGSKGGYALTLENRNNKTLFCRDTTFVATLDEWSNSCGSIVASTTINFGNANQTLEILPGPANVYFRPDVGNSERLELEKKSGLILEFCDRQALMKNFRCGFNCEAENRKFDEKWDENITGGTKKFYCHSTGVKKKTSDPATCSTGYKPSADLMECERITCAGGYTVGQTRISPVNDNFGRHGGEKRELCVDSGFYDSPVVSCFEDYRKTGDNGCVHKSAYREYYLSLQAGGCTGPGAATTNDCQAAASRWCSSNYGYNVGFIQQLGADHAGLGCYQGVTHLAPYSFTVQRSWGPVSVNILESGNANLYCKEIRGMDLGIVHEWGPDNVAITCLKEDGHIFVSKNETACKPGQKDEATMSCRADAANACLRAGFGTGVVTEKAPWGMQVSCFRSGSYKLAPFVMN